VAVHPIALAPASEGRHLSGMPRLLDPASEAAAACLAVLDGRSRPFGTTIVADGGAGRARRSAA
jgi:hypothetical protein